MLRTHDNASGIYYNASPLSQKLYPIFEHIFLSMIYFFFIRASSPPPPLPITIGYVTIMPCQRSHKRKFPTTPLVHNSPEGDIYKHTSTIIISKDQGKGSIPTMHKSQHISWRTHNHLKIFTTPIPFENFQLIPGTFLNFPWNFSHPPPPHKNFTTPPPRQNISTSL